MYTLPVKDINCQRKLDQDCYHHNSIFAAALMIVAYSLGAVENIFGVVCSWLLTIEGGGAGVTTLLMHRGDESPLIG